MELDILVTKIQDLLDVGENNRISPKSDAEAIRLINIVTDTGNTTTKNDLIDKIEALNEESQILDKGTPSLKETFERLKNDVVRTEPKSGSKSESTPRNKHN